VVVVILSHRGGAAACPRAETATVAERLFPPPWSVQELEACFIGTDSAGAAAGTLSFEVVGPAPPARRKKAAWSQHASTSGRASVGTYSLPTVGSTTQRRLSKNTARMGDEGKAVCVPAGGFALPL